MQIAGILLIPLAAVAIALCVRSLRAVWLVNVVCHAAAALAACFLAQKFMVPRGVFFGAGFFYVDSLSCFFLLTISLVNFVSMLYSRGYLLHEIEAGVLTEKKARGYYALCNLFAFTMFMVTVVNNLGLMWVAVEMTTLASAFLVGFYRSKASLEAAWKYVIICSVGITLALLGTVLLYFTVFNHAGLHTLDWTGIVAVAGKLNPRIVEVSFLFVLLGYGTKAGLAPMHTWLPDAHSQAPAPVSALLSGVLLKTSVFAILRFLVIVNKCVGGHFAGTLLVGFGLLSAAVACVFILVQKDIKRLLAYSSIEHIGVIAFGLGLGTPASVFAGLLHVFNHAMAKSLMFFGCGSIVQRYKSTSMHLMRGVVYTMPFTAIAVMAGACALCGMPPFSLFLSEFLILASAFSQGLYAQAGLMLLFLAIAFAGIIHHFSRVVFGRKPKDIPAGGESRQSVMVFLFLGAFLCVMGVYIPYLLQGLLKASASIITGA